MHYLNTNNLIYKHQYGFQKSKNTIHPMIHLINELGKAKNEKKVSIGVFCDLSKGFDTISHTILLQKMEKLGIRGKALEWFRDYLFNRKQFVYVNNVNSDYRNIRTGVPQGSILGPILFLIYINDLPNVTSLVTFLFADDSNFLISGKNVQDLIVRLNTELKIICDWFRANKLSLNPQKTKVMFFNIKESSMDWENVNIFLNFNNQNENDPNLMTKLNCIRSTDPIPAVKFLGLYLDANLDFKYHIKCLQKKISRSLYTLKCMKSILNERALLSIYFAFIHSHLLYCLPIYSSGIISNIKPLIKLQKKAIRVIAGKRYNSHTAPLFHGYDILPLPQLADFSKLSIMYDFIRNRMPTSFNDFWQKNSQMNELNLRDANLFYIPTCKYDHLKRFPAYHYQKLWNGIIENISLTEFQPKESFLKNLKKLLLNEVETNCSNPRCPDC